MGLISVVTGESRFLTSVSFRKDGGSEKLSQHSSSSMLVSGVPRLELETLGLGVITLAGTEEDLALEGEEIGVRLGELLADLALFGGKGGKRRGGRRRGGRRRGESSLVFCLLSSQPPATSGGQEEVVAPSWNFGTWETC